MTALALQAFLEEKDPIQSSISSTQNLGCGVSRALENFFEYGVYRCQWSHCRGQNCYRDSHANGG